jgi:hypothetical protein
VFSAQNISPTNFFFLFLVLKMQSDDFSWMVPIEIMLGSLNHGEVQACSISNVPDELREVNEDAYKPKADSFRLE